MKLCGSSYKETGFLEKWITLIMEFIRTVSYSIVFNGQVVGKIQPTRGLSQGDLISPYIFLLCAEALSSMLSHAEANESIIGRRHVVVL